MRRLADAGFTTREACGNSVRNITCCPYAGVATTSCSTSRRTRRRSRATSCGTRSALSAAQVQDRLRRVPARTTRSLRSTTSASARRHARHGRAALGFRVNVGGGTATMCTVGQPAPRVRCPLGRYAQRRRGHGSRLPPPRRLPAQAQEPDEVPDQVARLGALARRVRAGWRRCPGRGRRALPFGPDTPPGELAPDRGTRPGSSGTSPCAPRARWSRARASAAVAPELAGD